MFLNEKVVETGKFIKKTFDYGSTSEDYGIFVLNTNCRPKNKTAVDKIKKSIQENGNIANPIVVYKTNEGKLVIVSGTQHFLACKELKVAVYFNEIDEQEVIENPDYVKVLNDCMSWKSNDFIDAFAKSNEPFADDYKRLQKLSNLYPEIKINNLAAIATDTVQTGGYINRILKTGLFRLSIEKMNEVQRVIPALIDIQDQMNRFALNHNWWPVMAWVYRTGFVDFALLKQSLNEEFTEDFSTVNKLDTKQDIVKKVQDVYKEKTGIELFLDTELDMLLAQSNLNFDSTEAIDYEDATSMDESENEDSTNEEVITEYSTPKGKTKKKSTRYLRFVEDKFLGVINHLMIYMTYDYTIFKYHPENRVVNTNRVNKLVNSMKHHYFMVPIIVNEKFEIIDGQHRYEAAMKEGLPIYFIVIEGLDSDDIRALNCNITSYSVIDYINKYALQGNLNYIRFKALLDEYFCTVATLAYIIMKKSNNKSVNEVLKAGKLSLSEKDYLAIRPVIEAIRDISFYTKKVNGKVRYDLKIHIKEQFGRSNLQHLYVVLGLLYQIPELEWDSFAQIFHSKDENVKSHFYKTGHVIRLVEMLQNAYITQIKLKNNRLRIKANKEKVPFVPMQAQNLKALLAKYEMMKF